MNRTEIKTALSSKAGQKLLVKGWVRTHRNSKNVSFINVNDGSTINNLQIVAEVEQFEEVLLKRITTGAAISAEGELVESQGGGQNIELKATGLEVLGDADPEKYPLQPKRHSLEFLREIAHLRPRTNTFGAILRIRHAVAFAIHDFFNSNGFYYLHSPIITGSDAEGAGEMFHVTTHDLNNVPKNEDGNVDYKSDFFEKETNLTVSGQLEAELGALALSKVYTFAPTFRAENSNTTRHLAEFWMIEPEAAFTDIHGNMDLAENCLKNVIRYVLKNCEDDLSFLDKRAADEDKQKPQNERQELSLIERLNYVIQHNYERITYTDAINILLNSKPHKKKKFQFPIEWGADLQSEHERYLVEKHFKKPVIVTDYPKKIKAFYMYQNDGEEAGKETVRGMDILFPGIGEIVGGSQREHRLDRLKQGVQDFGIPEESVWWYLETRQFGTCEHSGFGLGFERLVQFVTGMGNIRDVIPFPRTPGNAEF